jgi:hypothetical protein
MAWVLPQVCKGTKSATLLTATAITQDTNGDKFAVEAFDEITYEISVTAASGTSPTMIVRVQKLLGDGTTWTDIATSGQFTTTGKKEIHLGRANSGSVVQANSVAMSAGQTLDVPLGAWHRLVFDVGGTSPSFTTAVYCTAHARG